MNKRVVVDPITRIEGHLRIEAQMEGDTIAQAYSSGTMRRRGSNSRATIYLKQPTFLPGMNGISASIRVSWIICMLGTILLTWRGF